MDSSVIYLDTYVLQKDMRIRMPKSILANLRVEKGVSLFDVYYDSKNQEIILKVSTKSKGAIDDGEV